MVLSPFLKAYPYPEKPGTLLVFSTRKASSCLLPEALFRHLERGEVPDGVRETLTRLGVLVADAEAEKAEVLGTLERLNRMSTGMSVAVILGMACNFRCGYCYEGSRKGTQAMEPATAERLVAFLEERVHPGMEEVILDFYGGEPLLYVERIVQLSEALGAVLEPRGIRFSFTLVTNGSLLTPEVVARLRPLGLMGAKVTLDGPPEIHDRSRPFASGQGSFDVILENLQDCSGLFPVGLGGTYARETHSRFPALLDLLVASGLGPDRISQVSFGPVMRTPETPAAPELCVGCATVNEPWLAEAAVFLREEVLKRGFRVPRIAPAPCMVDRTDAFTVNWDGTLAKCPGLIGDDHLAVGDLWRGFRDYGETFDLGRLERAAECRECPYLPLCFGGCRYMRLQREGHLRGVECQRPFLDATLGAHLLQDLRYRHRSPG